VILVGYGHDLYLDNVVMKIALKVWATFLNIPTMVTTYWDPNQILGLFFFKRLKGVEWKKRGRIIESMWIKNVVIPNLGWIAF